MPDKVTLTTLTAGHGSMDLINTNFSTIETWINTYGLDVSGTGTNLVTADIDMNGNTLLNYVLQNENGWENKGDWATTTAYVLGDVVAVTVATDATYGGASYYCLTAHTSGTFSTDYITSGYWQLVAARGAAGATGSGSGDLIASNNLSDVVSLTSARSNLGIDGSSGIIATGDLADDAVTLAKIASGTDGELITWDASGDPATVAVGTSGHILTSNGAGAAPTFQANGSAPTVVTQDQMETATNNTAMMTAESAKWHPGAAKAWVIFAGSDGTKAAEHNVASVVRNSLGNYTVTFTTALSSANFAAVASAWRTTFGGNTNICNVKPLSASTCGVHVMNRSGTSVDSDQVMLVVYGDFA